MIYIQKGPEPEELTQYRRDSYAAYENMPQDTKHIVREKLLEEQGHRCAYCMVGIHEDSMQIEHYFPRNPKNADASSQKKADKLALNYNNMLGVCAGAPVEGDLDNAGTCDESKGDQLLQRLDPRNRESLDGITYKKGEIVFADDATAQNDINVILRLNRERLIRERLNALAIFKEELLNANDRGQLIRTYRNSKFRAPYLGIIWWYLDTKNT